MFLWLLIWDFPRILFRERVSSSCSTTSDVGWDDCIGLTGLPYTITSFRPTLVYNKGGVNRPIFIFIIFIIFIYFKRLGSIYAAYMEWYNVYITLRWEHRRAQHHIWFYNVEIFCKNRYCTRMRISHGFPIYQFIIYMMYNMDDATDVIQSPGDFLCIVIRVHLFGKLLVWYILCMYVMHNITLKGYFNTLSVAVCIYLCRHIIYFLQLLEQRRSFCIQYMDEEWMKLSFVIGTAIKLRDLWVFSNNSNKYT